MDPIRVLVADMVALDRDIVERIAAQPEDMTIVGSAHGAAEAAAALEAHGADVLLTAASGTGPLGDCLALLGSHPDLAVVVVDPADRLGLVRVCRLVERVQGAGAPWAEYLLDTIRSVADRSRED
ncbi:hypothetical protein [Streptomyces griseorubiginosus]|uniref:hypothetical protein n=1 Tax=Streptomyces griseorubiginosus TaxID=67304 RepID=UPI003657766C